MSNQAQIDAVENLLIAALKQNQVTLPANPIFDAALSSIMGSDGPGGPKEKSQAAEYLNYLKSKIK
jgi:hypothetical protein